MNKLTKKILTFFLGTHKLDRDKGHYVMRDWAVEPPPALPIEVSPMGWDLIFAPPMSFSLAYTLADAEGREQMRAVFQAQVNNALEEVEAALGTASLPIQMSIHDQLERGGVALHAHYRLDNADVPDPAALFQWVNETRRAFRDRFAPDAGAVLTAVDHDEAPIFGETGSGPTSSLQRH